MPLVSKAFGDIITFTRASTGTFFNSAGVLTSANSDIPRFDYNPSTLAAQGLLIEEARTNGIRNNTMQGAVAGTPGTLPTNWSASLAGGLSREVVGTGTVNGVNYVDLRVFGTTTNTNLPLNLSFETATQIAATTGQTWSESVWVQMVNGSTSGISEARITMTERTSGGVDLAYLTGANFISTISSFTRRTHTATTANASTAFITPTLWVYSTGIGAAIDITLRIGLPQLELGAFATSVIPTTTTALTRSADVASVNPLNPWFNATEGTLFAEYSRYTNAIAGRIATFSNGTNQNQIRINASVSTNIRPDWQILTGGSVEANVIGAVEVAVNAVGKTAGCYATNDFQQATNGTLGTADTIGTVPSVTTLHLGANEIAGNLNGWLRRVSYFPRRLSNAELQAITA